MYTCSDYSDYSGYSDSDSDRLQVITAYRTLHYYIPV